MLSCKALSPLDGICCKKRDFSGRIDQERRPPCSQKLLCSPQVVIFLPFQIDTFRGNPKCHPLRSASSPPSPAPCLSSRLAHSLCTMGSVCSHLPTLASLFQACVRNCLLRAIWQLTSATSFQLRPPPFLGGFHKTMLTSTQTFPRA